jgi:preprotein translocase subunit SecD
MVDMLKPLTLVISILLTVACQPTEKRFQRFAPFRPGVVSIHIAQEHPAAGLKAVVVSDTAETIFMNPSTDLTEKHLRKIAVWRGKGESRIVVMEFTQEGAAVLARISASNVGNRLAFVVDGRVVTAPTVRAPINYGSAVIEANFTSEQADHLARVLSGS